MKQNQCLVLITPENIPEYVHHPLDLRYYLEDILDPFWGEDVNSDDKPTVCHCVQEQIDNHALKITNDFLQNTKEAFNDYTKLSLGILLHDCVQSASKDIFKPDPQCLDCNGSGIEEQNYNPECYFYYFNIVDPSTGVIPLSTVEDLTSISDVTAVMVDGQWHDHLAMPSVPLKHPEDWPELWKDKVMHILRNNLNKSYILINYSF